jgi:hypothetical protein
MPFSTHLHTHTRTLTQNRTQTRTRRALTRLEWAATFVLLVGLLSMPAAAQARSLDEATDELAKSLVNELQGQSIKTLAILQFSNPAGDPTERERSLADSLAKAIAKLGGPRIVDRLVAERTARRQGLPPGVALDAEAAHKLAKRIGVSALIVGTIKETGNAELELQVEVYSAKEAGSIASAQTTAEETKKAGP